MSLPPGGPPCLLSPSLYHQAYPRILKDLVGYVKAFTPYLEDREPPVLPARKDKIEHAGRSGAQQMKNSSKQLTWDTGNPCSTNNGLILSPQGTSVIPYVFSRMGHDYH